ncbi:hypothetical protein TURU_081471 [Turdus rufiventris]|nr:hypothetical protein TURU_081471 [Turdus rufiventris]
MNPAEGAAEEGAVPDSEVDAFFRTGTRATSSQLNNSVNRSLSGRAEEEGFGLASPPITEVFNTSPTGDRTAISSHDIPSDHDTVLCKEMT